MGFFWRLLPVFLAYFSIGRIDAWGREGHFMVCKIAEKFLTEDAREAVANLLPPVARGDLAAVCSWADDILTRYPWSFPLHYVNTPGVCNYDQSRDCHNDDGVQGMCVVGAINNYTTQLRTFGQPFSRYNLTESLMFLAHFVGDVHDPVDVSFYDDEGGIFIIVYWYGSKTNLHRVWDVNIVQTAINKIYKNNVNAMIESIEGNITENWNGEIIQWQSCASNDLTCVTEYASESIMLCCDYAYKGVKENSSLGDEYFFTRLPVVEKRIAQAGVRLAALLNNIFYRTPKKGSVNLVSG